MMSTAEVYRKYQQPMGSFLSALKQSLNPKSFELGLSIDSIILSRDQTSLFIGLPSDQVVILNLKTGTQEYLESPLHETSHITSMASSASRNLLFTGSTNGSIKVWNFSLKCLVSQLEGHRSQVTSLSVNLEETTLVSGDTEGKIIFWNTDTMEAEFTLHETEDPVHALMFSPEGKYVLAGCKESVKVWNAQNKDIVSSLDEHEGIVYCIAMSTLKTHPKVITAGQDRTIVVWNFYDSSVEAKFVSHEACIKHLKLTYDNEFIVSASEDNTIKFWSLNEKEPQAIELACEELGISGVELPIDDSCFISSDKEGNVKVWNLSVEEELKKTIWSDQGTIFAMKIQNDEGVVHSIAEGSYKVWNCICNEVVSECKLMEVGISSGDISPLENFIVLGDYLGNLFVFSAYKCLKVPKVHKGKVSCVKISDNYLFSGSENGSIVQTRLADFGLQKCYTGHKKEVTCLLLDKTVLVSGGKDKELRVWNLKTGQEVFCLVGHTDFVFCLAINESYILSGGADNNLYVWDPNYGNLKCCLKGHQRDINSIVSYENCFALTGSNDCSIGIWSLKDEILLSKLELNFPVLSMEMSPNKKWILVSSGKGEFCVEQNPLLCSNEITILPRKYSVLFLKFLNKVLDGDIENFDCCWTSYVIYPQRLNVLHIFTHIKNSGLLGSAIKAGAKYFESQIAKDPLWQSLQIKSKQCLEVILRNFEKHMLQNNPQIYKYFESSLIFLNKEPIQCLERVYFSAHKNIKSKSLPAFGNIRGRSPVLFMSETPYLDSNKFLVHKSEGWNKEEEIQFFQSRMKLPLGLGCWDSIKFLQSSVLSKNEKMFKSHIIKSLLDYKWRGCIWLVSVEAFIYLCFITMLLVHSAAKEEQSFIFGFLYLFNVLFTAKEVLLLKDSGAFFSSDSWNIVESVKIILLYVYLIFEVPKAVILSLVIILAWIRGIGYFRLFKPTRYLIRLLIEVFKDMVPFFLIMLCAIFIFAVVFFILEVGDTFTTALIHSYILAYGEFNTEDYDTFTGLLFLCASVLNTLILLNLIIAIMGDTYDKVTDIMEIADKKEFATLILEAETMMVWRRRHNKWGFLQECRIDESFSNEEKNLWQGKINEIKKSVKSVDKKCKLMMKEVRYITKSLDKLPKTISKRINKSYSRQNSGPSANLAGFFFRMQKELAKRNVSNY